MIEAGFACRKPAKWPDLVGVGGFSWSLEFRVGSEGLEGLEGTKLSKHPKPSKLIFSFLELELITRTKNGKTFYSPWHIARLKGGAA